MDEEGISATSFGEEKIWWSDVKEARLVSPYRGPSYIRLELYDAKKYPRGPFYILNPYWLQGTPQQSLNLILERMVRSPSGKEAD